MAKKKKVTELSKAILTLIGQATTLQKSQYQDLSSY